MQQPSDSDRLALPDTADHPSDHRRPLVTLRDIAYTYGDGTTAVQSVSLRLLKGEVTSIVGPSGCGKSTLLSILAGLRRPSAGTVEWDADEVARLDSSRDRLFTMVFQKDTLLPWLTTTGNISFGLRYLRLSGSEKKDRLSRLLRMGRLEDFADSYPYQLSGGMRRRVAFLTSVAPLPRMLLLDEPFSALDEPTRVELHRDVLSVVYELGITVLLVTHDLGEAVSLSDEVHILTNRPARIAATHRMDFGHDRDVLRLRESGQYQDYYRRLWAELRSQILI